jgi:hypothetical protein
VSNNVSFITVTSGASGTGNGTVGFSVPTNPNTAPRTGTLTIAGQIFTVTQAANCSYNLSPASRTVNGGGETASFTVSTAAGCGWTAQSSAGWITTSSSGTGSGSVSFTVGLNIGVASRTGTITVGGQTFTVTQNSLVLPSPPGKLKIITTP